MGEKLSVSNDGGKNTVAMNERDTQGKDKDTLKCVLKSATLEPHFYPPTSSDNSTDPTHQTIIPPSTNQCVLIPQPTNQLLDFRQNLITSLPTQPLLQASCSPHPLLQNLPTVQLNGPQPTKPAHTLQPTSNGPIVGPNTVSPNTIHSANSPTLPLVSHALADDANFVGEGDVVTQPTEQRPNRIKQKPRYLLDYLQ